MKKTLLCLLALVMLFSVTVAGCGSEKAEEAPAPGESLTAEASPALSGWNLTASTWSSPNGATVNLSATPAAYAEGQTAAFVIRLEGEEVENIPCDWNGSQYTASAELNAADGYCYYVILTAADGAQSEVAVNTPTAMMDEALINMETALQSYCSLTVVDFRQEGNQLTITDGTVTVQLPLITDEGEEIVCDKAVLVLTFEGQEVDSAELTIAEEPDAGSYNLPVTGVTFTLPEMEDDQALELRLDVTLSNDQTLSALGGSWFSNGGNLMLAVG